MLPTFKVQGTVEVGLGVLEGAGPQGHWGALVRGNPWEVGCGGRGLAVGEGELWALYWQPHANDQEETKDGFEAEPPTPTVEHTSIPLSSAVAMSNRPGVDASVHNISQIAS